MLFAAAAAAAAALIRAGMRRRPPKKRMPTQGEEEMATTASSKGGIPNDFSLNFVFDNEICMPKKTRPFFELIRRKKDPFNDDGETELATAVVVV